MVAANLKKQVELILVANHPFLGEVGATADIPHRLGVKPNVVIPYDPANNYAIGELKVVLANVDATSVRIINSHAAHTHNYYLYVESYQSFEDDSDCGTTSATLVVDDGHDKYLVAPRSST